MTTGRGRPLAGRVYRGEGATRAPKWERHRSSLSWCPTCSDYTEHDPQGCVECFDPELDEPPAVPPSVTAPDAGVAQSGSDPAQSGTGGGEDGT